MFWQITKREIYDNMTSLRFGFTVILLVLLMVINAIAFVTKGYREGMENYRRETAKSLEELRGNCSSVYNLVVKGPGRLYKEPSPLVFCADGGEENLPGMAEGRDPGYGWGWGMGTMSYNAAGFWRTYYPHSDRELKNIMPEYLKTDWAFMVGVLISFAAILFTFNSISGERERGTLRLILAGSVARSSVILGKFAGAFISVMLPLILAILLNLVIINVSGAAQLDAAHWGRIGLIVLISAIYVAIFVCLGILISALCSRSSTSLLTLLLIWVVFVILMPNILGSISSGLRKVPSMDEIYQRMDTENKDLWKRYEIKGLLRAAPSRENPDMEVIRMWADCLTEERQIEERITDEHLDAQLAQIQLARQITRVSPTSIYRYALESLSNTGFERHCKFIANVRVYRDMFWDYIKAEDQKDPDSLHVYFIREGVSDKPANFDNAPRFKENFTVSGALQDAISDVAILALFAVIFFMVAYISFMRADVK
jgi:ABC-type transport system involved in multi-copper enzyme maturation permease subunit